MSRCFSEQIIDIAENNRCYKPANPFFLAQSENDCRKVGIRFPVKEKVQDYIRSLSGTDLDPHVVELFLKLVNEFIHEDLGLGEAPVDGFFP